MAFTFKKDTASLRFVLTPIVTNVSPFVVLNHP
jgi:hypothetical protein